MLLTRPKRRFPLWIFTRNFLLAAAGAPHPVLALIFAGSRTDYQTLERQAAQVAAALENALDGQKREKESPLAAVLLPRTPQLYAAMLGAMRAGVPYLLLSCDLPAGRIRQILSQSGAQAVLSTPQILARLGVDPAPIACVDMENLPESQAPARAVPPDALAYVVYTSGSTGVPKGVEISRWSLLNLSQAMQAVYGRRRGAFGVQRGV